MNGVSIEGTGPATGGVGSRSERDGDASGASTSVRKRFLATGVDQVLASSSNILTVVVASRALPAESFGLLGILMSGYILVLGASRSLAVEPFLVRHGDRFDEYPAAARCCVGGAALVGLAGVPLAVAVLGVGGRSDQTAVIAFAVCLPALLVQDACRFLAIGRRTPWTAVKADGIWLLVTVVGLALTQGDVLGSSTLPWIVSSWTLGAVASALYGLWTLRLLPSPVKGLAWLRREFDLGGRFLGEYVTSTAVTQALVLVFSAVGGAAVAGSIQGALSAMGPVSLLIATCQVFLLPEAVRIARHDPARLRWICGCAGVVLLVAPVAWVGSLSFGLSFAGDAAFGRNWEGIRSYLLPVGAVMGSAGPVVAGILALRAVADSRTSFKIRLVLGPATLAIGASLAAFVGVKAALYGVAATNLVAAVPTAVLAARSLVGQPGAGAEITASR